MAAHQAPLSLRFSRQEYWTGLPFPSPMHACMHAKSLRSCLTLCDPMDSSPPGSSVHGFSRQEYWTRLSFPSPFFLLICLLSLYFLDQSEELKRVEANFFLLNNQVGHSRLLLLFICYFLL